MIINLKIEITEKEIMGFLREYPEKNIQDLLGEINNTVYLGGDCIAAMMMRLHDINCEHYIEKSEVNNQLDYLAKISDDVFYARLMSENKWNLKAYSMSRLLDHYLNDYLLN